MGLEDAVRHAELEEVIDEDNKIAKTPDGLFSWKVGIEKSTFAMKEMDNTYVIEPVYDSGYVYWHLTVRQKGKQGVLFDTYGTISHENSIEVDMGERARQKLNRAMRILNTAIEVRYSPDEEPTRMSVDDLFTIISMHSKPSLEELEEIVPDKDYEEMDEVCPDCGSTNIYDRETKRPVWRCNYCESTFNRPDLEEKE